MPGEGSELALSALGAVVWWVSVQIEMTLLYLQSPFFLDILLVHNTLYSYQ